MTCPHCGSRGQQDLVCLFCGAALHFEAISWLNSERTSLRRHYHVILSALKGGAKTDMGPGLLGGMPQVLVQQLPLEVSVSPYAVVCVAAAISAGPLEQCFSYQTEDGEPLGDFVRRTVLRPFEQVAGQGGHFALFRVAPVFSALWPAWAEVSEQ